MFNLDSDDSVKDPDFNLTESDNESISPGQVIASSNVPDREPNDHVLNVPVLKNLETRKNRQERQKKRNSGQEYKNKNNKIVAAEKIRPLRMCRNKCIEKYNDEVRSNLFEEFWAIADYNKRSQFISDLIEIHDKKTCRIRNVHNNVRRNRAKSAIYHFRINGSLKKVCKECFRNTFDISTKFIELICKKKNESVAGVLEEDKRGRHKNRKKVSHGEIESAKAFILSLPLYESHYTRKRSAKKYLPPYYTLTKIYEEFKKKEPNSKVHRKLYEDIFRSLNIKIKMPKKDTCGTCDKLKVKIQYASSEQEKLSLQKDQDLHHLKAEQSYSSKKKDKDISSQFVTTPRH